MIRDLETIGDVTTRVMTLLGSNDFKKVATAIKTVVVDLRLYSNVVIGIKSKALTVGSNLTVELPTDVSKMVKVGIVKGRRMEILNKKRIIKNKAQYDEIQTESARCANCSCTFSQTSATNTEGGRLPDVFLSEMLPAEPVVDYCSYLTFHNYNSNSYCYANPRVHYGAWEEQGRRLLFSGVTVGTDVVIEYETLIGAEDLQLVPKSAFYCILYAAKSLFNLDDRAAKREAERERKRFELNNQPQYTFEELYRALRR
jgi:hypothetical protein